MLISAVGGRPGDPRELPNPPHVFRSEHFWTFWPDLGSQISHVAVPSPLHSRRATADENQTRRFWKSRCGTAMLKVKGRRHGNRSPPPHPRFIFPTFLHLHAHHLARTRARTQMLMLARCARRAAKGAGRRRPGLKSDLNKRRKMSL